MPLKSVSFSEKRIGSRKKTYKDIIGMLSPVLIIVFIASFIVPVSAAGEPTVTILEYNVNPSVLMPDSLGTITITVKNTATSATVKEITGDCRNRATFYKNHGHQCEY